MARQTSLWAHESIKQDLGRRQATVLEVIRNFPGCDNHFISEKLKIPINQVTPRTLELRKMGKVKEAGQKKNIITGRLTLRWEVL